MCMSRHVQFQNQFESKSKYIYSKRKKYSSDGCVSTITIYGENPAVALQNNPFRKRVRCNCIKWKIKTIEKFFLDHKIEADLVSRILTTLSR